MQLHINLLGTLLKSLVLNKNRYLHVCYRYFFLSKIHFSLYQKMNLHCFNINVSKSICFCWKVCCTYNCRIWYVPIVCQKKYPHFTSKLFVLFTKIYLYKLLIFSITRKLFSYSSISSVKWREHTSYRYFCKKRISTKIKHIFFIISISVENSIK